MDVLLGMVFEWYRIDIYRFVVKGVEMRILRSRFEWDGGNFIVIIINVLIEILLLD